MKGMYILGIAFSGVLLGCADAPPEGDVPPRPTPTPPPAVVAVENLPELDEPFGPLDEGRVNVSPPKGWHIASRSSDHVIRFQVDRALGYPTILVTAEDVSQPLDVDGGNVAKFIAARMADPKMAKLVEPITPIELDGRQFITYQRRAKIKGKEHKIIELLFFETVVAGRKYTVELRTYKGTVNRYRPYAMAVAGAIEFIEDEL
jgi:hypothetical protein